MNTPTFLDRIYQTTHAWPVRMLFFLVLSLLFILPIYDLCTGHLSHMIWIMIIVSTLLFLYVFLVVFIVGKWNKDRQRMHVPSVFVVWIIALICSCLLAFYRDAILLAGFRAYYMPMAIAFVGFIIAITRVLRYYLLLYLRHKTPRRVL